MQFKVLSIDVWANEEPGSWDWNNWFEVDTYDEEENGELNEENALRFFFYSLGYVGDFAKFSALYAIDDDQYNLVLIKNHDSFGDGDQMPIYAIEYGSKY